MSRKLVVVVLGAIMALGIGGQALAGSGAGAIDLTFPIGARYNALGEAGTALSQDATALWWNTGGLAFLPLSENKQDAQMMTSKLAQGLADDIRLTWFGFARPVGEIGAIAFGFDYLTMGWQEAVGDDGEPIRPEEPEFHAYSFSVSAGYGARLSRTLGVGVAVKYFHDSLAPDWATADSGIGSGSADSFGFDFGALWKVRPIRSMIGLSVANLGPDITHSDATLQSDPMPRKATLGIAHSAYAGEFGGILLVADLLVPLYKWEDNDYGVGLEMDQKEYGFGVEFNYLYSLFLRFGWKSAKYGDIQDLTYGMGVDLEEFTGKAFSLDFAWVPQAEGLPSVTRLSAGYRF